MYITVDLEIFDVKTFSWLTKAFEKNTRNNVNKNNYRSTELLYATRIYVHVWLSVSERSLLRFFFKPKDRLLDPTGALSTSVLSAAI